MVNPNYRLGKGVMSQGVTIHTMRVPFPKPHPYRFFEVPSMKELNLEKK